MKKQQKTLQRWARKEDRSIDRRTFLKRSAQMGLAGLAAATLPRIAWGDSSVAEKTEHSCPDLKFRADGKFKILQLTDTHYVFGDPRSRRALQNVEEMLDLEKPDLVIHTGDVIYGKPAEESLREILAPLSARRIPFAVTFGNHDEEFGKSRQEVFDIVRSLPYNINVGVPGIHGVSNDVITLSSARNADKKWILYLFDSLHHSSLPDVKGYDYIHFDQIAWYRRQSEAFTRQNGGAPIPSLAFFHIPFPEYIYALRLDRRRVLRGNFGEEPASPGVNSGLFVSMKEMGDIRAVICGHDHDNDYAMQWNGMFLMFGRFSGCDTVYNDLKPSGARIIELTEGESGFRSWIRVYGQGVTQDLRYPQDFETVL